MIRKISAALSFLLFVCVVIPMDNHFFGQILHPNPAFAQDGLVLEDFALYSQKEIKLDDIGESRGNVGSNGSIDIKKGASGSVIGSFQALGDIKNEAEIGIYGDVIARVIEDKGSMSVSGQKIERADLVPLNLPTLLFSSAGPNLEVPEISSMAIAPGSYGRLKVKKGAALKLSSGAYYFVKFEIDESASVNLDVSGGAILINVIDKIKIGKNVDMQIVGGNSDKVLYNYRGTDKVKVEDHARLRGIVKAPSAQVELKKGSRLEGAAYADGIHLEKGASFRHYAVSMDGRPPTADAGGYQTALAGGQVELDGSGSSDPDGDAITYHWAFVSFPQGSSPALSDPSDPMPTFTADRVGVYVIELSVYDGTHISLRDTATVTAVSQVPGVADFVLYADDRIKMDEISGGVGHVGANRHLLIEKGTSDTIAGDLRVLDHIKIDGEITIAGDVITNSKIDDHGVFTVTGVKIENAALTLRMLPRLSFSAEGPDLKVPESASQALVPGSYGRVEVKKGAALKFTAGSYFLRDFETDDSGRLFFDVSEGAIELNVAGKLGIGKDADLQISGGSTRDVLINYAGKKVVEIEDRCVFRGTLVAPKARVEFEKDSRLEGAVYAGKIYLDRGVSFHFHAPLAANNPPAADSQSITTAEDTPAAITLSGSDPDGDSLTFAVISQPEHGILAGTVPNLTYTPDLNYSGTDTFSFTVSDGNVDSDPATVTITVAAVNDPPIANAQTISLNEDETKPVTLSGSDTEGDALAYLIVEQPTNGTLAGTAPDLIYTPHENYNGSDSFTFKVNDGQVDSQTAAVSITINPVNDAPVALSDNVTTDEDTAISAVSVLANDTDVDGDTLLVAGFGPASHGTAADNGDGTCSYTPDADFHGTDTFAYTISDDRGGIAQANVTVTVNPVNDAPKAVDDALTTEEDAAMTVAVLVNDTDVDGDPLVVADASQGANGTVSINPDGTITYTPRTDFNGSDSFTYIVDDGNGGSDTATVSITVNPVNDAPVANAQSLLLNEDESKTVLLSGFDAEGDELAYEIVEQPSNGTLSGTAPDLTYTPHENYNGTDAFSFTVNDGTAESNPATVNIAVAAVNDPPVASAGTDQTVFVGDTVSLNGGGSSDVDGEALSFQWTFLSVPAGSTAALSSPSIVDPGFVPDIDGIYEVQLIVNDGTVDSASDSVMITADLRMVVVPDVVGQIQADAEAVIIGADLTVSAIAPAYSVTVPPGHVISQEPASGASIVKGSAVDLVVSAGPEPNIPAAYISASPATIQQGESTFLSWSSFNVQSAHIDQGIGVVSVADSIEVFPEHTTTYSLTVTGSVGSASAQVTVTVTGTPAPQPVGSFGKQYEDLVPPDATIESFDPSRFSVVTGLVRDLSDLPIADVAVTLFDNPEYGTAKTDAEGRFSLPIDGGATFTLVYQKQGLITSHRKVYVPWNDIAVAETIQMVSEDPLSTVVIFDGNPNTVVTHRSSQVTDQFGSRSAAMVFTGDNRAYAVDSQGSVIHELTTITTRATEYATPESMPAVLPPTSAYTYCVEMSVDGVKRVKFAKPVITWVNNFLGFPVGEIVPVGFYDRDRGAWVPLDNGVVVQLLDTDANGIVDALDATGDGHPNDLDNDGSFSDEVAGLGDPGTYSPGATFWRVQATHFSPVDYNWPLPGQPNGATAPDPPGEPASDGQKTAGQTCSKEINSYITQRSRIFHEDIPITGTGMTLHYASNRVKDYHYELTVPASGETIPASLKRIIVTADVAGRRLSQVLQPEPYQTAVIVWDGLDYLGRPVSGRIAARTNVGFVYDTVYNLASRQSKRAFAQPGNAASTVTARQELVLWRPGKLEVYPAGQQANSIAEGWTLSGHHYLSPASPSTLFKGDGTTLQNYPTIMTTVAGDGSGGAWGSLGGDNGPATEAQLGRPMGLAVDAQGNLYIADSGNHRVRKVDPAGIITTIAGSGPTGLDRGAFSGDGGPATQARLNSPYDVAVDAEGNLFIADLYNHRVRKVDTLGIITTVAGSGSVGRRAGGFGGDNGPAVQARLDSPAGIALDTEGNLFIADSNNGRVRKVDPTGIITTIAGNQPWNYGGDGGPAISAGFDYPFDVAADASGNIYVVDLWGYRVRKIDAGGIITTVAGSGNAGDSGDGWQAVMADLDEPLRVAVDTSGNLYISDSYNGRVRKVDQSGIINTVAGTDSYGYSGDGGPATLAELYSPAGLAVDAMGNLYISDVDYQFVRKVAPLSVFADYMADGYLVFAEEGGLGHVITGAGRHTSTIDLQTGLALFDFGYDEHDNLVTITDRFANQVVIERDADGVPTAIVSPDGQITVLTVDADNHLRRVTHPDGSYYQFEYSLNGLMTAEIEPEGNRFEHIFNETGRLTDVLDPEGGHWNYLKIANESGEILSQETTGEGNITSYLDRTDSAGAYTSTITDPTGATTSFSQTGDGIAVNKSLPCGMELEFRYDIDSEYQFQYVKKIRQRSPSGLQMATTRNKSYLDTDSDDVPDQITESVTVNGKTTTRETSILEAETTITSPEGRVVTTRYDPQSLLTASVSVPGLYDTAYAYDARGRLTSTTTNTRQTTLAYDTKGFLKSATDPENQTTTYSYDPVGRITGISRPDGGFVGFAYDKNGNMSVLTNPVDVAHGFGFNAVNLNSSYQTPLSGSYSYTYDKDRRLVQTNFPSGKQIFNIYDNTRLSQVQTPEGNIDFTYLCGTKIDSISKGSEAVTYGYDGKLVTSETLGGTLDQPLSYTYNNDFKVSSFTYAGQTQNYGYDNDGLLIASGDFSIGRNAGNGLPEAVSGGGLSIARTFNGYGEVGGQSFTVGGQNAISWTLSRDNNGRIISKTETVGGVTKSFEYGYDSMGRLLTVTKDGTLVEEYSYDLNGTRVYETNTLREIIGRDFSYSDGDHLLTAGSMSYAYDMDGFLTSKTDGSDVTSYTYSSRGELLNVMLPDGTVIEYLHDPLGRRIAKKINGAIVEKYLWQGLTRLLAVYDGSDNLLMWFEYADDRTPVAMTAEGATYYLGYDQVGSLRMVADSAGNVVKLLAYDSFGNIIDDTNPSFAVPIGFAGGLYDPDTELVRFGYRDYDPDIGRWTAKDPIGFAGRDTDLYGYVLNDPINLVDPKGLLSIYGSYGAAFFAGTGGQTPALNATAHLGFLFLTESNEPLFITYGAETDPEASFGAGAGYGPTVGFMTGTIDDFAGRAKNLTIDAYYIGLTFTITDKGAWGFSASWGGKGIGLGYYFNETNTVMLGSVSCPEN